MIYGYSEKQLTSDGLLQLASVSFEFDTESLRQIAHFLNKAADALDASKGAVSALWHLHVDEVIPAWRERFPNVDIVVIAPPDAPDA